MTEPDPALPPPLPPFPDALGIEKEPAMDTHPDLPVIQLVRGAWRADVFDPRPNPNALGYRYVQGGYVGALHWGERCLTGQASEAWDPHIGRGLPEVFEWSLGAEHAAEGKPWLRIGAGRDAGGDVGEAARAFSLGWEVEDCQPDTVTLTTSDEYDYGKSRIGYRLRRTIRLMEDGLLSQTTLRLAVPWNCPVAWFAHPFFAQTRGDATRFGMPPGAVVAGGRDPGTGGADGIRLPEQGGLVNVVGLWGVRAPVTCHLDPDLGGGCVTVEVDRPLDHVVLYASPRAASVEPQLARSWKNGEEASWSIRYRWGGVGLA